MPGLFDDDFLRKLEGLRILARRVPAGGRHAEQRSRRRGAGVEFTDVRPYSAGDDFRAIDWHIYQRLDKLFLRLFLEDQDLPVTFLVDQSRSMDLGSRQAPSKSFVTRRAVAALAYITLAHMDRVTVLPFSGEALQPLPSIAGKRAFHRLLRYLEALPTGGGTSLLQTLRRFAHARRRRGLCVIASDLYDPAGPEAVIEALAGLPQRLLILRPVHKDEADPGLDGEVQVVDCESGAELALTFDEGLRRRYREAYERFATGLHDLARRRGAGLLSLRTDQPVVEQLTSLFPQGVLRV